MTQLPRKLTNKPIGLLLIMAMLFTLFPSTTAWAQAAQGQEFQEWSESHLVDQFKEWTVTFNEEIKPSTINKANIYVKDHLGHKIDTTPAIGPDKKTIIVAPPGDGYSSQSDYTLYIENIQSVEGTKLKNKIKMNFYIKDDMTKEKTTRQENLISLDDAYIYDGLNGTKEIIIEKQEFEEKEAAAGSIIIIEPSPEDIYGYAGKITSIEENGEKVTLKTEEPTLDEILGDIDINIHQDITAAQMMAAEMPEGVEARQYQRYDAATGDYVDGVEYLFGAPGTSLAEAGIKHGGFTIKGSIRVENPSIDYTAKKTFWGKTENFNLAYNADIVSKLEIEYQKSLSGELDKTVPLFSYPIPIGATGFVADIKMAIYAEGDVKADGVANANIYQTTAITLGARINKGGGIEWVRNALPKNPEFNSNLDAAFKANAEVGINPVLELSYLKLAAAGLDGKIGPYLKCDAKADGGLDLTSGYFKGYLHAETGIAFSGTITTSIFFDLKSKDYPLGRLEIKRKNYDIEYNAETQGQLQSIKISPETLKMKAGESKQLKVTGIYKNTQTGSIFEDTITEKVEFSITPSNSAVIDGKGNLKITNGQYEEIDVTASYKGKKAGMMVYVERENVVVDKTALLAAIETANAKHDAAVEGSELGQYAKGSKAIFEKAIVAAQETADDNNVTQTAVDQAVDDLAMAETNFDAARVVEAGATDEAYFVVTWSTGGTEGEVSKYFPRGLENQLSEVLDPIIPSYLYGITVTAIGGGAFRDAQLTSVVIPKYVTCIEREAFENNNLTDIIIPDGVTYIGPSAFAHNQITNVKIPGYVTSIENYAFENNNLTSIIIPDSVTSIGYSAFENNNLTSIIIPGSVTRIEFAAFFGNEQLSSITIGANVTIESKILDHDDKFSGFYNAGGKKAGTYVKQNDGSWVLGSA